MERLYTDHFGGIRIFIIHSFNTYYIIKIR